MSIRPIPAIAHAVGLNVLGWGFFTLRSLPADEWIRKQKGGHWQFLTIQGLGIAWITLALSLASDFFPTQLVFTSLKRRVMMVALPLAVTISSVYWTLILTAPQLMLTPPGGHAAHGLSNKPKLFGKVDVNEAVAPINLHWVPLPLDLALHAAPAVALLLDFFLLERKFSRVDARYVAPVMSLIFGVWYASFLEYLNQFNRNFPYPFLNVDFPQRLATYGATAVFAYISFRLLNALHRGQPLLAKVAPVNKIVDPIRPEKGL